MMTSSFICGFRFQLYKLPSTFRYLLNAIVFHFLLDFGVGTLKHFPSMVQNYQAMDIRYGCIADFPCGTATGIITTSEPVGVHLCALCAVRCLCGLRREVSEREFHGALSSDGLGPHGN